MPALRRLRLGAGATAFLALSGLWISHALEYARVWGTRGLLIVLAGSVHAYMLPLGVAIGVLAAAMALRAWHLWMRLGLRLDAARASLRAAVTGRAVVAASREQAGPSMPARLLVAWPALTVLQVALYLVQENIEAARAGLPAPGIGAISGVHALAPAVHAVVALVLLLAVTAVQRALRRRRGVIDRIERAVRRVLAGRRVGATPAAPRRVSRTPLELIGCSLWRRPPPAPVLG